MIVIFKIKSRERRHEDLKAKMKSWHVWFAWYPVRVDDEHIVWLRKVMRRGLFYKYFVESGEFHYEYREILTKTSEEENSL